MKRIFATIAFLPALGVITAAPLSPQQALERALGASQAPARMKALNNPELLYTADNPSGRPALYVFGGQSGFIITPADDAAAPVLGYSDAGEFDASDMPPQMKWWLGEYGRQIEALSAAKASGSFVAETATRADRPALKPLLTTRWNQDAPYNEDCPDVQGVHCMTGCVATSMAQVMNYFKYPAIGAGTVKYTSESYRLDLEMDFSEKPFDWGHMLDEYQPGTAATEKEDEAVAYLMKACGYSVYMNYTPTESSTQSYIIAPALINNFLYDDALYYANRNVYSQEEWETLIYDNIANIGPVIYNGTSSLIGGHSFVCDGYDGNGYYHINWGWGGTSDGYFLLDAMNPGTIGIGGGSGGFNFAQGAVLGIQPPKEDTYPHPANLTQQGTLEASYKSNTLVFSLSGANPSYWINRGHQTFKFNMGAMFEPVDGTPGETFTNICYLVGSSSLGSLEPTYYYNNLRPSVSVDGMQDGRYKVTLMTRDVTVKDAPWYPILCDYRFNNYIYVTKAGGEYTVEVPEMRMLNATSVQVEGDLYIDCMALFTMTIENPTDYELTQGFAPLVVYNNQNVMMGESMLVTVAPHETVTKSIYTSLYALASTPPNNSKVTIRLYNPADGLTSLYKDAKEDVILKKNPGLPTISVVGSTVAGEPDEDGVYDLALEAALDFKTDFKVLRGYFAYPLYAVIADSKDKVLVQKRVGEEIGILGTGKTASVEVSIDYPQAVPGEIYNVYLSYARNYSLTRIGSVIPVRFSEGSGICAPSVSQSGMEILYDAAEGVIKAVSDAPAEEIVLYNASGMVMARATGDTLSTASLGNGLVIAVVRDSAGRTHSRKLLL